MVSATVIFDWMSSTLSVLDIFCVPINILAFYSVLKLSYLGIFGEHLKKYIIPNLIKSCKYNIRNFDAHFPLTHQLITFCHPLSVSLYLISELDKLFEN